MLDGDWSSDVCSSDLFCWPSCAKPCANPETIQSKLDAWLNFARIFAGAELLAASGHKKTCHIQFDPGLAWLENVV
jgi:hypothetical protein